jgi:hypothetical protein
MIIETVPSARHKTGNRHKAKNVTNLEKLVCKVIPAVLDEAIVFKPALNSQLLSLKYFYDGTLRNIFPGTLLR